MFIVHLCTFAILSRSASFFLLCEEKTTDSEIIDASRLNLWPPLDDIPMSVIVRFTTRRH